MSVFEMKLQYPKEVEWFMKQGEHRAARRQREESLKQAARPKLWPIIPASPTDRW